MVINPYRTDSPPFDRRLSKTCEDKHTDLRIPSESWGGKTLLLIRVIGPNWSNSAICSHNRWMAFSLSAQERTFGCDDELLTAAEGSMRLCCSVWNKISINKSRVTLIKHEYVIINALKNATLHFRYNLLLIPGPGLLVQTLLDITSNTVYQSIPTVSFLLQNSSFVLKYTTFFWRVHCSLANRIVPSTMLMITMPKQN